MNTFPAEFSQLLVISLLVFYRTVAFLSIGNIITGPGVRDYKVSLRTVYCSGWRFKPERVGAFKGGGVTSRAVANFIQNVRGFIL